MEKKYVIIDSSEVDNINFDEVLQTSKETLRYNLDGTKTFVKWEGETPDYFFSTNTYTNEELLEIINNIDNGWYEE